MHRRERVKHEHNKGIF